MYLPDQQVTACTTDTDHPQTAHMAYYTTHDVHPDRYKLCFYNLLFAYSFASTPPAPHLSSPSFFSLPLSAVSLFLSQGECGQRVCMIAVDFSVTSIRIIVPCALGFSYCVACLVCAQTRVIPQLSVLVKVGHYTSLPPENALPGLHFRLFFFLEFVATYT